MDEICEIIPSQKGNYKNVRHFIVIVAFTLANLFLNCNCESSFIIAI